jgi:hypothetical protein
MNNVEVFGIEESPCNPGKWLISIKHENFLLKHTTGSFNIICARLMNLSYAQYLRFCRDMVGGEISGKGHKYPVVYFQRGERLQAFVRLLNTRANMVLWEREHPDWEKHQAILQLKGFIDNVLKS